MLDLSRILINARSNSKDLEDKKSMMLYVKPSEISSGGFFCEEGV